MRLTEDAVVLLQLVGLHLRLLPDAFWCFLAASWCFLVAFLCFLVAFWCFLAALWWLSAASWCFLLSLLGLDLT